MVWVPLSGQRVLSGPFGRSRASTAYRYARRQFVHRQVLPSRTDATTRRTGQSMDYGIAGKVALAVGGIEKAGVPAGRLGEPAF
jgi:hypothetical protein